METCGIGGNHPKLDHIPFDWLCLSFRRLIELFVQREKEYCYFFWCFWLWTFTCRLANCIWSACAYYKRKKEKKKNWILPGKFNSIQIHWKSILPTEYRYRRVRTYTTRINAATAWKCHKSRANCCEMRMIVWIQGIAISPD